MKGLPALPALALPALVLLALAPALALLALPSAAAAPGDVVDLVAVDAPERTLADHPFDVRVELRNRGEARQVYLFAALYEGQGEAPCGSAADPRFRTYTPLYQAVVRLPAGAVVPWPPEGDRWPHEYGREHVDAQARADEFCVFVAQDDDAPSKLDWLDFESVPLATRGENALPEAAFSWEPATPRATRPVVFTATGMDPDGDPVTFSWDFGRHDATGRARAEGAQATHAFYPEGAFTVTLTASDGFEERRVAREVVVGPAPAEGEEEPARVVTQEERATPFPATLAPLAGALAAAGLRRRPTARPGRSPAAPPRPPRG